jgi:peptidoglycan/xylan/chitin deacetylase (PgdA/CDA1 family)
MFFEHALVGDRLPTGTLALTFDDGPGRTDGPPDLPGPRTAELGAFLRSEGVPAAFFAVGKFAREHGDVLATLRAQGHLVANHTDDHPSLPAFVARGGDVVGQLARTDLAIGSALGPGPVFFRPPYGDWRLRGEFPLERRRRAQPLAAGAGARRPGRVGRRRPRRRLLARRPARRGVCLGLPGGDRAGRPGDRPVTRQHGRRRRDPLPEPGPELGP